MRDVLTSFVRNPFQSLASRIVVLVVAMTLLTSLVVTLVSTHTTQRFLREKIDQKFPAVLASVAERLDLWYAQRRLDIETFASSDPVGIGLLRLRPATSGASEAARAGEVTEYLSYVLERLPQYRALFLLDLEGRRLAWVGEKQNLGSSLRAELASVTSSAMSDLYGRGDGRFQVISAAVKDDRGRPVGSLHALLALDEIRSLLRSERLTASGEVHLIARDGSYLTARDESGAPLMHARSLPDPFADPVVEEYDGAAGFRVVGSALALGRFGWTLTVEERSDDAFQPAFASTRQLLLINLATVIVASLLALRIAFSIVRPIRALYSAAQRIAEGEVDVVIPEISSHDELELLTRTFNRMTARLKREGIAVREARGKLQEANSSLRGQSEELQRANEALEQLSITDGLTRLYNHRFFQEHLTREIARVGRSGDPLTLILVDIDNFKQLNDTFGHAAGDAVLADVAGVMMEMVRGADVLARYGGEEFALVPVDTTLEGAVGTAEKLRIAISEHQVEVEHEGKSTLLRVTVSVGVAEYRGNRKTFFNDADRALYRAKAAGKDCVMVEADSELS